MNFMGLLWPETDLGQYANVECPCYDIIRSLAGRAFRLCDGNYSSSAYWSNGVDISLCVTESSDITSALCQAAMVNTGYLQLLCIGDHS